MHLVGANHSGGLVPLVRVVRLLLQLAAAGLEVPTNVADADAAAAMARSHCHLRQRQLRTHTLDYRQASCCAHNLMSLCELLCRWARPCQTGTWRHGSDGR